MLAMFVACAVCGLAGTQENSLAYFAMTWLLSGLPLAMIGGVGFWVYRRASAQEDEGPRSASALDSGAPPAP